MRYLHITQYFSAQVPNKNYLLLLSIILGLTAQRCFEFSSCPSYFALSPLVVIKADYRGPLASCSTSSSPISLFFFLDSLPSSFLYKLLTCRCLTGLKVIAAWLFMSHPACVRRCRYTAVHYTLRGIMKWRVGLDVYQHVGL